jgi:hypothetical protein
VCVCMHACMHGDVFLFCLFVCLLSQCFVFENSFVLDFYSPVVTQESRSRWTTAVSFISDTHFLAAVSVENCDVVWLCGSWLPIVLCYCVNFFIHRTTTATFPFQRKQLKIRSMVKRIASRLLQKCTLASWSLF